MSFPAPPPPPLPAPVSHHTVVPSSSTAAPRSGVRLPAQPAGDQPALPFPDPVRWPPDYPAGYAVVDVETTGLGRADRVVSVGVYRLDAQGDPLDHWYSLVNPERDPGPVWIHGLTAPILKDAPTFPEIAGELSGWLDGHVMVAHNALFDWNMLAREYLRAGDLAPVEQRLCTIVLARDLALPLRNHKLATLAEHFGIEQRHAHHALDDARVLAEVFRPSLRLAVETGLGLPLHTCLPLTDMAEEKEPQPADRRDTSRGWNAYRSTKRRPPCPYRNPGRWEEGGPLVQGMRVAITGDTATERELLEDRAVEAGLHIATSVSRLTSLLVTNETSSGSGKTRKAGEVGTPMMDEQAFLHLLRDVAPGQPS